MTEKLALLEIAPSATQTTTEAPAIDGGTVSSRQKLEAASSTTEPLAFAPYKFSRIEFSPDLKKAVPYGQLSRLELERLQQTLTPNRALTPAARAASLARDRSRAAAPPNNPRSVPDAAPEADPTALTTNPKTWLGVVIACLLGAVPIILLVLVRWQGNGPEVQRRRRRWLRQAPLRSLLSTRPLCWRQSQPLPRPSPTWPTRRSSPVSPLRRLRRSRARRARQP